MAWYAFFLQTPPACFPKVWFWLERLLSSYPAMRQKPCSEAMSLMCRRHATGCFFPHKKKGRKWREDFPPTRRRPPAPSVLLREKPWIWQGFWSENGMKIMVTCKKNNTRSCSPKDEHGTWEGLPFQVLCSFFPGVHTKMYPIAVDYMGAIGQEMFNLLRLYGGLHLVGSHNPPYFRVQYSTSPTTRSQKLVNVEINHTEPTFGSMIFCSNILHM